MKVTQVTPEVTSFTSIAEIPMLGALAVSAFLVRGDEPILIDTGMTPDSGELLSEIGKLIDPADIKWIWLTHADRDHTGSLTELLALAPAARIATHFITFGIMDTGNQPIPFERSYLVRPGTVLKAGDRELVAFRPPLFDNPGTMGFFDRSNGVMFTSDFLGGTLPDVESAAVDDIAAVPADTVAAGQLVWGSVDAPWSHSADPLKLKAALDTIHAFDPSVVLSTHLPPVRSTLAAHLETVARLPGSDPTEVPDQEALEAAMSEIAH